MSDVIAFDTDFDAYSIDADHDGYTEAYAYDTDK